MSGRTGPSGPLGVIVQPPPPPPAPPVALYVPETLLQSANQGQLAAISQVQVRFAARVSELLAASYAEIIGIVSQRTEEAE